MLYALVEGLTGVAYAYACRGDTTHLTVEARAEVELHVLILAGDKES